MEYLFLASIGPVQGFIASARRSRDLYFGSWLLSELAKAAAREIAENYGIGSLIFPAPVDEKVLDPNSGLSVANKIVARIPHAPGESGNKVREAMIRQLHSIRDKAYSAIKLSSEDSQVAFKQIDDLVEYFWAAVPFAGSYTEARKIAEALMAARKNTRDFDQVTWGSNRPKSSIDGQLESVIPEHNYPSSRDKVKNFDRWKQQVTILYTYYGARPSERLSGVDLLKRKGKVLPAPDFPSTSHMAAISFLDRLNTIEASHREEARQQWETYIQKVQAISDEYIERVPTKHAILGDIEGSLLFEERLADLLDFVENPDTTQLKAAKEALRHFYQYIDDYFGNHARPNPYYAILQADGDHMGKVIDQLASEGPEQHKKLSQSLDTFSRGVRSTIESYQGALVYAGGDDVLAFLPLHTALKCASKLASDFRQQMNSFKTSEGHSSTLSVGIAVIHHLHPLSDALNIVRAAEKIAKGITNKNALAITIRKRSGGEYNIKGRWGEIDFHLEKLVGYFQENSIPTSMAYELDEIFRRLTIPDISRDTDSDEPYRTLQRVARAEIQYIIKRKLNMMLHDEKKAEEQIGALSAMIEQTSTTSNPFSVQTENFINMLLTAQIFADATTLAKSVRQGATR